MPKDIDTNVTIVYFYVVEFFRIFIYTKFKQGDLNYESGAIVIDNIAEKPFPNQTRQLNRSNRTV